jgi:hypothetical protein
VAGRVSRGAANLVGHTAGLCGLRHGKASGPINYHAPIAQSTTHGEGSDQLPRTKANSHPCHMGVAEAAVDWRPGPTVYEECTFL